MKTEVKGIRLTSLNPNPHRQMETYPLNADKVDTLIRSFDDVGMWPSIIARPSNPGYEIAFGHHRVEAARQAGLKTIPTIVMDLNDDQMLQYMGRENGEDYKSEFLVMLNTWEAAVDHMETTDASKIANMLGWMKTRKDGANAMTGTAQACASGAILIREGHMKREDLTGLSVKDAREVCQHSVNRMRQIDKMAKVTGRPHAEVKKAKAQIARGARKVAKDVAAGQTLTKSIRGQADVETYRFAKQAKKQTPLFAAFADNLINQIARMVSLDSSAEKLHEIVMALPHLQMEEDLTKVRRVDFELGELVTRANEWRSKLSGAKIMKDGNVVHLKALPGGAS